MAISTIQTNEYVLLVASYAALITPKKGNKDLLNRKYTKQQLEFIKKTQANKQQFLNVMFMAELDSFKHPFFNYILRSYNEYKEFGNYPNGESLNKQNNKLIEYYNVLSLLESEQEQRNLKEQEKQAKKKKTR